MISSGLKTGKNTHLDQLSSVIAVINSGSSRSVPSGRFKGFFPPLFSTESLPLFGPSKSLDGKRYKFTGESRAAAEEGMSGSSCDGLL